MQKIIIVVMYMLGVSFHGYAQTQLTLEKSKSLALQNNANVKNSTLELEAAREIKKNAFTKYFPSMSASAMGMQAIDPLLETYMQGGNLPVYDGNPANLATATQFAYMPDVSLGLLNQMAVGYVDVKQPVYAGGRIRTGNNLSELNIEVKEKQQKLSENDILLKTEKEYWQVITLQEKQKTLDSYIRFLDTLYVQVYNAYKNGLVIKNDLLKVTIKQSELQVNNTQLQNGKKLALMRLCQTIGINYSSDIVLEGNLDDYSLPETYFVPNAEVLTKRAEYKLLEKSVAASKLETKMKRGDYLPSIGVGVTGYYLDQFENNIDGNFNGMVYASVSVPISDWWGGKHKLKEMKFRETMTQNVMEDASGLLNLQMEKGWTDLKEANDKVELIEETLEQTTENLKVNQDSYNNGLIQLSDLLEARALKAETEDKLIEAKNQYKVSITNYLQVTGR
ncbi:TolC family protein [Maribellus sp. YY47]|uniref:TolC family protein n=1 Tax=Maribellus sp. YY47 TaxID=2929486 RepID=UPI0020019DCC|nr:TolC family protein [Maribellus sp. YY47]MCK3683081.1 TolC family protein [Maribellus sp. YY47]